MGSLRPATASYLLLLVAASFCPSIAEAEPSLSLQAAVEAALQRAPEARAAAASVMASKAGVDVAAQRPNPSLVLDAENFAGSGPYDGSRQQETTGSLELPLEIGGKRGARIRAASAEQAQAEADAVVSEAEIVSTTTAAFVHVVEAQRRQALARERLDLVGQALRAAQLRVRNGKVSPLDEQRAEVERVQAQLESDSADRHLAHALLVLQQLTGNRESTIAAPWFDATMDGPVVDEAQTPALAVADARVDTAQAMSDLAQRNRIPDLTLSAGMRRFEDTDDTAAVLGVSFPLPILNSGAAEARRAHAELERAEALRAAARLDVARELAAGQVEVEDARAAAQASTGPALAAASEASRIARIGYREGKFSQLDLLEAERALNQTRVAAIDALVALHLARNRLALLQGKRTPLYSDSVQ